MNCSDIRERLNALSVALLSDDERQMVERHLASCTACREISLLERKMDDGLDDMFGEDAQLPFANRITGEGVLAQAVTKSPVSRWWTGMAVAAVLVMAVAIGTLMHGAPSDHVRDVQLDSPVRRAGISTPLMRIPELREQSQLAVNVRQVRENIVWVTIGN